ncbi:hypothetical protein Tco_0779845 [Tanacetum coccineum]
MCARYQAKPTKKHFEAIKRVFRYLKGTINMGLWYPKDNAMSLTAYADADHAGCQDSRRSTSGSAQFLGDRIVSCVIKEARSMAISTTRLNNRHSSCAQILEAITAQRPTDLTSIKFPLNKDFLAVTNSDTANPFCKKLLGNRTSTNVDQAEHYGKSFSRDPTFFLHTKSKPQSQSEEPKEESNSSPHPLWTVFQGNLKFVPKGESVEVFGMAIPDPLITEAIQQSSYYPKYLEMVAQNTKKTPQESASVQPTTKRATPKKPTTTTPVKQSKPAPAPTKKPSKHKLPQKIRKGKPSFQLVDEDDEAQQESAPQEEGDDPDLERLRR